MKAQRARIGELTVLVSEQRDALDAVLSVVDTAVTAQASAEVATLEAADELDAHRASTLEALEALTASRAHEKDVARGLRDKLDALVIQLAQEKVCVGVQASCYSWHRYMSVYLCRVAASSGGAATLVHSLVFMRRARCFLFFVLLFCATGRAASHGTQGSHKICRVIACAAGVQACCQRLGATIKRRHTGGCHGERRRGVESCARRVAGQAGGHCLHRPLGGAAAGAGAASCVRLRRGRPQRSGDAHRPSRGHATAAGGATAGVP